MSIPREILGYGLFRCKKQVHYKTAVKATFARVLCTRVRAAVVFSKNDFKITLLVRTRVQSIAFQKQNFDFELDFSVLFESTTKPQREAQNDQSEGTILTLSWLLQWLSRSAQKDYYRTADFWVQVAQGPIHSRKQVVWRTQCAKHEGEHDFEPKTSRTRAATGTHDRILENVTCERRGCRLAPARDEQFRAAFPRAPGQRWR